MREVVRIGAADVVCTAADVLALQGVPPGVEPDGRVLDLAREGVDLFRSVATPVGVFEEIDGGEFAAVYRGVGRNAPESPLASIHPRAERLALFAVTVGPEVSRRIDELFEAGAFALGAMLDSAASQGAENTAARLERHYAGGVAERAGPFHASAFLRYSPGYCGWHVSGQGELFERLRPEEIGITLRESFLMEPLKSISGVIIGGEPWIHRFDNDYPFCPECRGKECRARIRGVLAYGQ